MPLRTYIGITFILTTGIGFSPQPSIGKVVIPFELLLRFKASFDRIRYYIVEIAYSTYKNCIACMRNCMAETGGIRVVNLLTIEVPETIG